jgi:cytochrome c oxidase subunit 3
MSTLQENRIHPHKFALWLGIASIVMLFASFTSAYIVRSHASDWIQFNIPTIFWINTAIIFLSSATMHFAYTSFKKYQYAQFKLGLALTLVLGIAFTVGQYNGWLKLASIGMFLDGNPAGSFIYVISFIHLLHILGGWIVMLVMFIRSLLKPFNPNNIIKVQLLSIYWHFVDVLWIYLILFFQIKLA